MDVKIFRVHMIQVQVQLSMDRWINDIRHANEETQWNAICCTVDANSRRVNSQCTCRPISRPIFLLTVPLCRTFLFLL